MYYIWVSGASFGEVRIFDKRLFKQDKESITITQGLFVRRYKAEDLEKAKSPFNFTPARFSSYFIGPFRDVKECKFFILLNKSKWLENQSRTLVDKAMKGELNKTLSELDKVKNNYPEYYL